MSRYIFKLEIRDDERAREDVCNALRKVLWDYYSAEHAHREKGVGVTPRVWLSDLDSPEASAEPTTDQLIQSWENLLGVSLRQSDEARKTPPKGMSDAQYERLMAHIAKT